MNPSSVNQVLGELNGSPRYVGTITGAAATASNLSGTIAPGRQLLVQADVDCYILGGESGTPNITTANGLRLAANQTFYLRLRAPEFGRGLVGETHLQVLPVSGTVNLKVFVME
jgi:hypothetical protein